MYDMEWSLDLEIVATKVFKKLGFPSAKPEQLQVRYFLFSITLLDMLHLYIACK